MWREGPTIYLSTRGNQLDRLDEQLFSSNINGQDGGFMFNELVCGSDSLAQHLRFGGKIRHFTEGDVDGNLKKRKMFILQSRT